MSTSVLTVHGKTKIQQEIEYIKSFQIGRVEERVKEARLLGDLALIDDAGAELKFYQERILYLENLISTAKVKGP